MTMYDKDFYLWTQNTAEQIRQRQFDGVDWDNLIEEIEALGRSEKRAIRSYLIVVIKHLLKWQYQPEQRSGSWRASIRNSRGYLQELLDENPSLKGDFLLESLPKAYKKAREEASDETTIYRENFPEDCPYSIEQLLDSDFLP